MSAHGWLATLIVWVPFVGIQSVQGSQSPDQAVGQSITLDCGSVSVGGAVFFDGSMGFVTKAPSGSGNGSLALDSGPLPCLVLTVPCAIDSHCDDGVFCNGQERCSSGLCIGGSVPCVNGDACCEDAQACGSCDLPGCDCIDNFSCTVASCVGGACVIDDSNCLGACCFPGVDVCIDALSSQACADIGGGYLGHETACDGDPDNDGCVGCDDLCPFLPELCMPGACGCTSCSDGIFCNGVETCDDATGTCQPGPFPCPDGLGCCEDTDTCASCDTGCSCDDGRFCNGTETCDAGTNLCVPGSFPCADGFGCCEEIDSCDVCGADCDCDDGVFCNGLEQCVNGLCVSGVAPCINGDACCEDSQTCGSCDAMSCDCVDNLSCTIKTCVGGVCIFDDASCAGACCFPGVGVCIDALSSQACIDIIGVYLGHETTCDGDPDNDGCVGCDDLCPFVPGECTPGVPLDCDGNLVLDECEPLVTQRPLPDDSFDINDTVVVCMDDGACANTSYCVPAPGGGFPGTCYVPKNRYISIDRNPANTGATARRVSVQTQGGPIVLGWLSEPVEESGLDNALVSGVVTDPAYSCWEGTVHLGDCHISPQRTYLIEAISIGLDVSDPANFSEALELRTVDSWGDVIGGVVGGLATPPQGVTNLIDAQQIVKGFQGTNVAPKVWLDLHPVDINHIINLVDAQQAVKGFQGDDFFDLPGALDPFECAGLTPYP